MQNWDTIRNSPKRHRRSSSYPTNFSYKKSVGVRNGDKDDFENYEDNFVDLNLDGRLKSVGNYQKEENNGAEKSLCKEMKTKINSEPTITITDTESPLKVWSSLPTLNETSEGYNDTVDGKVSSKKFFIGVKRESEIHGESDNLYKLSNVIKVDYAEVKLRIATSSFDGKKGSPARKCRKKVKIIHEKRTGDSKSSDGSSDTLNYEENAKGCPINELLSVSQQKPVEFKLKNLTSKTIKIGTTRSSGKRKTSLLSGSAPEFGGSWSAEIEGQKELRTPKKSFMEDGGSSVQPMATGYFPRPIEGQSLTSFLSSAQFARANAELDRENAHFSISEAMIAAIEQVLNLFSSLFSIRSIESSLFNKLSLFPL